MPSVVSVNGGKFTLEEENIVIEHIRKNSHNLQQAFELAAEELIERGRETTSKESVCAIYYTKLRNKYPMFTLEGRDQSFSNTKAVQRDSKVVRIVENPTVAQLARQYNNLSIKQKQDFQVLIK